MTTEKQTTKSHLRSPTKIYFLLITLVGTIGTLVSFGILTFSVAKQLIITNDEYIAGDRYYEMDACNSTMIAKPTKADPNNYAAPTEEEKATCKAEKKTRLIQSRKVMFKQDILSGSIWGLLFLALLLTHYPRFIQLNKKD